MTGKKSCKIQVSCKINLSEDPLKVKIAILNVFPELEISLNDQQLIGKSNDISSLSNISQSIHTKNTKNTYQRILKKNSNENSNRILYYIIFSAILYAEKIPNNV